MVEMSAPVKLNLREQAAILADVLFNESVLSLLLQFVEVVDILSVVLAVV